MSSLLFIKCPKRMEMQVRTCTSPVQKCHLLGGEIMGKKTQRIAAAGIGSTPPPPSLPLLFQLRLKTKLEEL